MTENAKKKIISRQEAADMLGVLPQSISNCAERGLIRTVHSNTNNFVYFLHEDVEALLPHITEIKDRERAVIEYKEALKKEETSYRNVLLERSRLLRISRLSVSYTKHQLSHAALQRSVVKRVMPVGLMGVTIICGICLSSSKRRINIGRLNVLDGIQFRHRPCPIETRRRT